MKFKTNLIENKFILFLLVSNFITRQEQNTNDARMPRVNIANIKNFQIPFPPLEIQQQIVENIESLVIILDSSFLITFSSNKFRL